MLITGIVRLGLLALLGKIGEVLVPGSGVVDNDYRTSVTIPVPDICGDVGTTTCCSENKHIARIDLKPSTSVLDNIPSIRIEVLDRVVETIDVPIPPLRESAVLPLLDNGVDGEEA
jgi:hypothetical protein